MVLFRSLRVRFGDEDIAVRQDIEPVRTRLKPAAYAFTARAAPGVGLAPSGEPVAGAIFTLIMSFLLGGQFGIGACCLSLRYLGGIATRRENRIVNIPAVSALMVDFIEKPPSAARWRRSRSGWHKTTPDGTAA
jgi:hypothetical protein